MASVRHYGKKNYRKIIDTLLSYYSMLSRKLSIKVGAMAGTAVFGFLFFLPVILHGQQYDLLIKNGHVIDPKNNIDTIKDVAIANGKIVKTDNDIPPTQSKKIIDATG